VLAIGAVALRGNPQVHLGTWGTLPLFDVGGLIAIGGLAVTLACAVIRNGTALARLEPRPSLNSSAADSTMPLLRRAQKSPQ
jgi:hypothetical protein